MCEIKETILWFNNKVTIYDHVYKENIDNNVM